MKKSANVAALAFSVVAVVFIFMFFCSRFLGPITAFAATPVPDIDIPTFNLPGQMTPESEPALTEEQIDRVSQTLDEFVLGQVNIMFAEDGVHVLDIYYEELFLMTPKEEDAFFQKLYQDFGLITKQSELDENEMTLVSPTLEEKTYLDTFYAENGVTFAEDASSEFDIPSIPRNNEEHVYITPADPEDVDYQEALLQEERSAQRASEEAGNMIRVSFTVFPLVIFIVCLVLYRVISAKKKERSTHMDSGARRSTQTQSSPYRQASYGQSTTKPTYQYGSVPYAKPTPKKDVSMDFDHCEDDRDYDQPVAKSEARLEQDERFSYALHYDKDERRKKIEQIQSMYDSGMIEREEYNDKMKQWK